MATTKKRINVSLSSIDEDDLWNAIAQERDTPKAKFLSHKVIVRLIHGSEN